MYYNITCYISQSLSQTLTTVSRMIHVKKILNTKKNTKITCLVSGSLNELIEDILDVKDQKDEEFKSNY